MADSRFCDRCCMSHFVLFQTYMAASTVTFVLVFSPRSWCCCLPSGGGGPPLTHGWSVASGSQGKEKDEAGGWSVSFQSTGQPA